MSIKLKRVLYVALAAIIVWYATVLVLLGVDSLKSGKDFLSPFGGKITNNSGKFDNLLTKETTVLYNDNNFEKLIPELHNVIKNDPNNYYALLQLGLSYAQLGNIKSDNVAAAIKSRSYIEKAMTIDPANPAALLPLGYSYELEGNLDKAIEAYEKLISKKTDDANAYIRLGHAHEMKGDYERAMLNYNKANELDKKNSSFYANLAKISIKAGDIIMAEKYYLFALKYSDNKEEMSEIHASLGSIYSNQPDRKVFSEKAIDEFEKAIDLNPDYALAYSGLGKEYYFRVLDDLASADNLATNLPKASKNLDKAIALNANESDAYDWGGRMLIMIKAYDQALQFFEKGVEVSDKDFRLFGEEKEASKAKFNFYKGCVYAQNIDTFPMAVESFSKSLQFTPTLVMVLKDDRDGFFKKIKDDDNFRSLITKYNK